MDNLNLLTATKIEIVNTIDELVYKNYKWNRQQFPHWTVGEWAGVYGPNAYLMEIRFQEEK
jgi:hypothetical protein